MGRVRRYGRVLSSISSRIRVDALTKVTKIRTSWKNKGISRIWNNWMPKLPTRATASPTVKMSGTAARTAIAMPRLVPIRYRSVKPVTTHAFRTDSTRSMRSPDEIPEHGVQAVVEAVGRHERGPARLGKLRDRPEDLDGGHGVRPGERLVEDQDLRFVGERLRELRPLSHSAAVRPRQSMRGFGQTDDFEGVRGGLPGVGGRHPVEAQQGLNELLTREPPVHLVVFRAVPEATHQGHVVPRILAEQSDAPLIRVELPDEELEQRALPRAVRTDEARDAATERSREGIQPEHFAVPLRDTDGIDDAGHPVTTSTAFMRMYVTRAARIVAASRITRDHAQSIGLSDAPNAACVTARYSSQ